MQFAGRHDAKHVYVRWTTAEKFGAVSCAKPSAKPSTNRPDTRPNLNQLTQPNQPNPSALFSPIQHGKYICMGTRSLGEREIVAQPAPRAQLQKLHR